MSTPRATQVIQEILKAEGGYVYKAEDRGGPTNFGITLATLQEEVGDRAVVTAETVKNLTVDEAVSIYKAKYVSPFEWINNDKLFYLVVDTAVNNGRGRATLWLQRAVGALEDGIIGPKTQASVNSQASFMHTYYEFFAIRMRAYGALVSQNHSQAVFVAGWLNRLARFVHYGS